VACPSFPEFREHVDACIQDDRHLWTLRTGCPIVDRHQYNDQDRAKFFQLDSFFSFEHFEHETLQQAKKETKEKERTDHKEKKLAKKKRTERQLQQCRFCVSDGDHAYRLKFPTNETFNQQVTDHFDEPLDLNAFVETIFFLNQTFFFREEQTVLSLQHTLAQLQLQGNHSDQRLTQRQIRHLQRTIQLNEQQFMQRRDHIESRQKLAHISVLAKN